MKTQRNFRFDSVTASQLDWLAEHLNTTSTAIIEHALAAMYHQEKATMNAKSEITKTPAQVAAMAQEALNNWDWTVEDDAYAADMKRTLEWYSDIAHAEDMADDDSLIHISPSYSDEWDWLWNIARSTDWQ